MNKTKLEEKVRCYILHLRDEEKRAGRVVMKENVARKFNVKPHEIDQIFVKLNREGLLSQAHHVMWDDRWGPDLYYIRESTYKLLQIIKQKDQKKLTECLEQGLDINAPLGKQSLLEIALYGHQNSTFVQFLLENGADPMKGDFFKNMQLAANRNIGTHLVPYIKDPFKKVEEGNTILHYCAANYPEVLESFHLYDGDWNLKNDKGQTPLIVACERNQVESVRFLLSKKVPLKGKDASKTSAFMHAYATNNIELMKLFLPYRHKLLRDEIKLFKKVRLQLLF